jgi:hypothetical protein
MTSRAVLTLAIALASFSAPARAGAATDDAASAFQELRLAFLSATPPSARQLGQESRWSCTEAFMSWWDQLAGETKAFHFEALSGGVLELRARGEGSFANAATAERELFRATETGLAYRTSLRARVARMSGDRLLVENSYSSRAIEREAFLSSYAGNVEAIGAPGGRVTSYQLCTRD